MVFSKWMRIGTGIGLGVVALNCGMVRGVAGLDIEEFLSYEMGSFQLRPQFGAGITYNDNVFYRETGVVDDVIYTLNPGLRLAYGKTDENYLRLTYGYTEYLYHDFSDQNGSVHSVSLESKISGRRLTFSGRDEFRFLSIIIGGSQLLDENGLFGAVKADRLQYNLSHTLGYQLGGKTDVYATGSYSLTDYEKGVFFFDSETWRAAGGAGYRFSEKTRFFVEGHYGQSKVSPNFSLFANRPYAEFAGGSVGMTGNFTPKLTGTVKVGYEHWAIPSTGESTDEPLFDVSVAYALSLKTSFQVAYSRRNSLSVQGAGSYTGDSLSLGAKYLIGASGKWITSANLVFSNYDYDTNRSDQRYSADLGLYYQIQEWLMAGVSYSYQKLSSDESRVIDYTVNQVTLSLNLGY